MGNVVGSLDEESATSFILFIDPRDEVVNAEIKDYLVDNPIASSQTKVRNGLEVPPAVARVLGELPCLVDLTDLVKNEYGKLVNRTYPGSEEVLGFIASLRLPAMSNNGSAHRMGVSQYTPRHTGE